MTKPEFEIEIRKLVEEYTSNGKEPPYGPRRLDAIYQAFKDTPTERFRSVISRAFTSERQAPLASDLLKIHKTMLEEERIAAHKRNLAAYIRAQEDSEDGVPLEVAAENARRIKEMIAGIGGQRGNDESTS